PAHDALRVLALEPEVVRLEAPRRDEDRVVLVVQLAERHVPADIRRQAQLDVLVDDARDVAVDDLARQAERRDTGERGAAGLFEGVEHRDAHAELGEIARCRQARAARADDRDLAARRTEHRRRRLRVAAPVDLHVLMGPIGEELLHVADRERLVDLFAPARRLARRGADGATDRRHGDWIESELPALFELTGRGKVEVAAAVRLHGAGFLARNVVLIPSRADLDDLVQLSHASSVMLPTRSGQSNATADTGNTRNQETTRKSMGGLVER